MQNAAECFWMAKLAAFLHDPPDKCLDIAAHAKNAEHFLVGAGFNDPVVRQQITQVVKPADHFDAAAERFGFPKIKCSASFAEEPNRAFIHPLSSQHISVHPALAQQQAQVHAVLQSAIAGIESTDWRKRFFLYWRRWLENAVTASADARFDVTDLAFLPADTRIPDHSIWNHMAVTSALAGCLVKGTVKPSLLLFQFGPVQDFIAQARSTRDLWSGSYLISWLMAHAMKAVTDVVGPDAIIFPSLRGNGIFDALHKDDIYDTPWADGQGGHDTTWQRICQEKGGDEKVAAWLLTPTLPNRFLAVIPEGRGTELAQAAESAMRAELAVIGEAVWKWLIAHGGKQEWKTRWDAQLAAFPQISWAVQPWLERDDCLHAVAQLPDQEARQRLDNLFVLAEQRLPAADRDERYYRNGKLNNSGILWSAHYALADAKLAARRNTRSFLAWHNPLPDAAVKDSLSGKEECIGDEAFWHGLAQNPLFSKAPGHRYGAMNLIKRLWCRVDEVPYLPNRLGLSVKMMCNVLAMDSTQDVASRNCQGNNPYIAVLALDGDEIGKIVSGQKTPILTKQLASKAAAYLEPLLDGSNDQKIEMHRLLTPAYHLQFSEALANFAVCKAGETVRQHGGELIYAGGDDVLALLPADRAIACAQALRSAFRTDRHQWRLYPGSTCEVSVGLAIGHQNAPLQMLVREAQLAEKTAKSRYGRGALALSLYKRSGESIQWGCKWVTGDALALMAEITRLTAEEKLSGRFPYALAQLLQPYALQNTNSDMLPVIQAEVRHVLARQGHNLPNDFEKRICVYLDATKDHLEDFINLFLAETFINRQRGEECL